MKTIMFLEEKEIPAEFYEKKSMVCSKCRENMVIPDDRSWSVFRVVSEAFEIDQNGISKMVETDIIAEGKKQKAHRWVTDQKKFTMRNLLFQKIHVAELSGRSGVVLEDAEYEHVKDAVTAMNPNVGLIRHIGPFIQAVYDAEKTDGTELDK